MKRKSVIVRSNCLFLLALVLLLTSVNASTPQSPISSSSSSIASQALTVQDELQLSDEAKIKSIIDAYFKLRYEGQKLLVAQDFFQLLADKTQSWVQKEKDKREIELSLATTYNLNYLSYEYTLDYSSIEIKNNQATVTLLESHSVVFAAIAPEVSRLANLEHVFTLNKTGNGWKILKDDYQDELSRLMANETKDSIIENVRLNQAAELEQPEISSAANPSPHRGLAKPDYRRLMSSHSYNRPAVVQYADYWATRRNLTVYNNETDTDCTNYISQAVYEGTSHTMSVPDNYSTKWYYDFYTHTGSLPWIRVSEFRNFMLNNYSSGGRGPKGTTLQSMCNLQPGDVTQLYNGSVWFHAVIIVARLNSSCDASSILYNAHTEDRFHYPLSYLSSYTKRYIAIVGWND